MIGSLDGSTLAFVPFLMVLGTFQGARLRLVTRFLPTPRLQTLPDPVPLMREELDQLPGVNLERLDDRVARR